MSEYGRFPTPARKVGKMLVRPYGESDSNWLQLKELRKQNILAITRGGYTQLSINRFGQNLIGKLPRTMKPLASVPEPDFDLFKRSCGIDFVRFFSTVTKPLPIPPSRTHIRPMHAEGHTGMLLTIQDPKMSDIAMVARELPEAVFDAVEVFYDFTPKGRLTLAERHAHIDDVRYWLISHLYPWQAEGIQAATRVSRGKRHWEPIYTEEVERMAARYETMYFGHSDSKYADPDEPNFASMKMYRKVTDNRSSLPPNKHRCRIEVTLNQFGCRHYGLSNPASLFGFDFRLLGPYFRLVKPEVMPYVMPKLRAWNPRMAEHLERTRMRMAAGTLLNIGSHAASREHLLNVDGRHRHKEGNRMIQIRLDDLTRKFKKGRDMVAYGGEWGSY